ncbi:hypothetical protein PIB30_106954 [Stylosanthes scabra]|uniref:Uncharacterized protein n=1 Tax=Stylosanthes scabra TaxID=79078 RepID=A0ABU6WX81_9FABA|nr:hypothetical protein [Stylosanthes scabra]
MHAVACCAQSRVDWASYVHDVYRMTEVFSVYRVGFSPPIPEGYWPPYGETMKKQISEDKDRKNEERKLAEQETKFGSKTGEELHAYAWKSTHMRATQDFSTPRQPLPRLGVAPWLSLTTHMREDPRICVGSMGLLMCGALWW